MSIKKYTTEKGGHTRYAVNVFNKFTGKTQWVGTFKTAEDAKLAQVEAQRKILHGETVTKRKDIAFGELVDQWLELRTANLSTNTKDDYEYAARYLRRFFKNRPVSSIDMGAAMRFVAWASEQKVSRGKKKAKTSISANYVRKLATRLSQVLTTAVELGYLQANPIASGVSNLPKQPRKRIEPLEPAQLRSLLAAIPAYWQPAVLLMATAGLRVSECFGLQVADVRLDQGLLHVRQQLVRGELTPPKTSAGVRVIPLAPSVVEALRQHLATVPASELGLLFPTEQGGTVRVENWRKRVWKPAVEAAGLGKNRKLTPHDLRRTFASAQAYNGRSSAFLQAVMGHTKATTTLSYYVGVFRDEQEAAARDMEKWLSREVKTAFGGGQPGARILPFRRNTIGIPRLRENKEGRRSHVRRADLVFPMAGCTGLEPATSGLTGQRSNQLS